MDISWLGNDNLLGIADSQVDGLLGANAHLFLVDHSHGGLLGLQAFHCSLPLAELQAHIEWQV
jgi:hypothetical protein